MCINRLRKTFLIQISFVTLLAVQCLCRMAEETAETNVQDYKDLQCFYQPPEACPAANESCRCKQFPKNEQAVICCDLNQELLTQNLNCAKVNPNWSNGSILALHIRNATLDVLNVGLPQWRRLISMSITDGVIGRVTGEFMKHASVQCLNLSSNSITHIDDRALVNLYNLSSLDLSHNNITQLPHFKKEGIINVDISYNDPMQCSIFLATLAPNIQFMRSNETICVVSSSFNWFNTTDLISLTDISLMHQIKKDCVPGCTCEFHRLNVMPGQSPTVNAKVDCQGLELSAMPSRLPKNTFVLNVSNNNITSLDLINYEPSYQSLRILYADNNQITSILSLEGTKFLSNFQILSLRNNSLKSLPTYILSNIFERFSTSAQTRTLYLGYNKVNCDCHAGKVLKVWLLTRKMNIPDYNYIYCENMNLRVSELDPSLLCPRQADWTDYIYYIIGLEVILLLFLIFKVSYDYWVFKTAGYLPWPANKMPKLPCDWLCE